MNPSLNQIPETASCISQLTLSEDTRDFCHYLPPGEEAVVIQGAPGFPLVQHSTWAAVSQQEVRLPWHSISMATLASETLNGNCWFGEASSRILICPGVCNNDCISIPFQIPKELKIHPILSRALQPG